MEYKYVVSLSYILINDSKDMISIQQCLKEKLGLSFWQIEKYLLDIKELGLIDVLTNQNVSITRKGYSLLEEYGITTDTINGIISLDKDVNFFGDKKLKDGEIYIPKDFLKKINKRK